MDGHRIVEDIAGRLATRHGAVFSFSSKQQRVWVVGGGGARKLGSPVDLFLHGVSMAKSPWKHGPLSFIFGAVRHWYTCLVLIGRI